MNCRGGRLSHCLVIFYIIVMHLLSFSSPFQCFHFGFRSLHSELFIGWQARRRRAMFHGYLDRVSIDYNSQAEAVV